MSNIVEKWKDLPKGYIYGGVLEYVGTASVKVLACLCRDDSDTYDMDLTSDITLTLTSSGILELDTGIVTSDTWYAVHIAYGSSGVSGLFSLSPTSPTLPSGYDTASRFIGWVRNNASGNIENFKMVGNGNDKIVIYLGEVGTRKILTAGVDEAWADVDASSYVPSGVEVSIITFTANLLDIATSIHIRENISPIGTNIKIYPRIIYVSGEISLGNYKVILDNSSLFEYQFLNRNGADVTMEVYGYHLEI